MAEGNMHIASKFVDVISGQACADVSMLSFRQPDSFVAGNLKIIFQPGSSSPKLPRLILRPRFCCGSRTVLTCKISFTLLKINIREKTLIRCYPCIGFFSNASSCKLFAQFISDTIIDWSLKDWGYLPVGKGWWSSPSSFGYAVYVMTTVFSICGSRTCHLSLIPFYTVPSHVKEKKTLFTIHNFKFTYVEANRIYMKVTSCILVLKSAKKLVRKKSGSAFHCLAEK